MKQSIFLTIVIVVTLAIALGIFIFVLGNPSNFKDAETRQAPLNLLGTIYTGGIIVPILIMLTLMNLTLVFERTFSLRKANGRSSITVFLQSVQKHLLAGKVDDAIKACDAQRGSAANIIRTGLNRYKEIVGDGKLDAEKKMAETKRAIEEATSLETPLLERNLIALSTIASIATMFGLLGTVIGMIRSFPRPCGPGRRTGRHPVVHWDFRGPDQHGARPPGGHPRDRRVQLLRDEGG